MKTKLFKLSPYAAAILLAACGGVGDVAVVAPVVPPLSISGLAATGAALGNATVTIKCASGPTLAGKTLADGTFSLDLSGGQVAPCMVRVSNGTVTLHGYASAAGRINITPLTDLVVTKALGSDAAAAFDAYDSAKGKTIATGLDAAKKYVADQMATIVGAAPTGDLLTGTFKVGDDNDKLLDKLGTELAKASKTLDDIRFSTMGGTPLKAALDRGTLVATDADNAKVLATLTAAQIDGLAKDTLTAIGVTGAAKCDVKVVALNYNTIGVNGEKANSSGVLLVPTGTGAGCTSAAPLVAYSKGTDVQKPHTLANPSDSQTFSLAAIFAAQGYAVVASDYLGYAKSTYAYHPYLHADSEATTMVDAIRAARNAMALSTVGGTLSGKVMVTGYSQGGHVSMATHRAIERDHAKEINLVAGAHLAGPYNLSGSFKSNAVIAGYQYFVPFLVTSWQKVYGNIYTKVGDAFKAPYDSYIEDLLPNPTLDFTTLAYPSFKLPGAQGETPTQARDVMFQSAFITGSQTDNNHPLFLAAKKNDTLGWSPKAATLLCGGGADPTVPPALHQVVMKADFDSRGLKNVTSVDVASSIAAVYGPLPDPVTALAAYSSYLSDYHGTKEPPFCYKAAKTAFDAVK